MILLFVTFFSILMFIIPLYLYDILFNHRCTFITLTFFTSKRIMTQLLRSSYTFAAILTI